MNYSCEFSLGNTAWRRHVPLGLIADAWWRHQIKTFSALLAFCEGNSPVTGEFPSQRPVTRSFDVFFDLRLNKWLRKQPRRRWFETLSSLLWRHSNGLFHHIQRLRSHMDNLKSMALDAAINSGWWGTNWCHDPLYSKSHHYNHDGSLFRYH